MNHEIHGLKELVNDQKKQIHDLHLAIEEMSVENVALRHALQAARGEIALMRQDRMFVEEVA